MKIHLIIIQREKVMNEESEMERNEDIKRVSGKV